MSRKYWMGPLLILLAAPLTVAAQTAPPAPDRATPIAPPKRIPEVRTEIAAPAGDPVAVASLPRETRRAVVADAARRFGVSRNAVVLARAEQVTWADGSLGCPEPGRRYTQMPVPGYRLVAKTAEGELVYHADTRGNLTNCAPGGQPPHEALKERDSRVEPRTGPPPVPER